MSAKNVQGHLADINTLLAAAKTALASRDYETVDDMLDEAMELVNAVHDEFFEEGEHE